MAHKADRGLFSVGSERAMSLRSLGVLLFISFGASYPHANGGEARPPYEFSRYNEDYSFLSDPTQRTDLFDLR